MDPILEEMRRAKDVQMGRFRSWTQYLCALVAAKDDQIATLETRIAELEAGETKRGQGRLREAVNG